jgi:hypothetical protein
MEVGNEQSSPLQVCRSLLTYSRSHLHSDWGGVSYGSGQRAEFSPPGV